MNNSHKQYRNNDLAACEVLLIPSELQTKMSSNNACLASPLTFSKLSFPEVFDPCPLRNCGQLNCAPACLDMPNKFALDGSLGVTHEFQIHGNMFPATLFATVTQQFFQVLNHFIDCLNSCNRMQALGRALIGRNSQSSSQVGFFRPSPIQAPVKFR